MTPTMDEIRAAVELINRTIVIKARMTGSKSLAEAWKLILILAQSVLDGTLVKAATQDEVASIVYNTVYGDTPTPKQEMAVRLECMAIARALVGKVRKK